MTLILSHVAKTLENVGGVLQTSKMEKILTALMIFANSVQDRYKGFLSSGIKFIKLKENKLTEKPQGKNC